jgi:hypothetical protein
MKAIIELLSTFGFADWGFLILFLSIFIDISPIKINPIKAVFTWISNIINKPVLDKIESDNEERDKEIKEIKVELQNLNSTVNKIIEDRDNKELRSMRWNILDFEAAIINGGKRSRDQYIDIFNKIEKYKFMVNKLQIDNPEHEQLERISEAYDIINSRYKVGKMDQTALFF